MFDPTEYISLDSQASADVEAYVEYRRIVGNADGGELFTEEQYEKFKKEAIEKRKNRIYVAYVCYDSEKECRQVGPQSFCDHRFIDHNTDTKEMFCREKGCKCEIFSYIPVRGSQDFKCWCKHSYRSHDCLTTQCASCQCSHFKSSYSCSCGLSFMDHFTLFETKAERIAKGKRVDNIADGGKGYAALGGITSFSSILDGASQEEIQQGPFQHQREKLNEEQEMKAYEAKYQNKTGRPRLKKQLTEPSFASHRPRLDRRNSENNFEISKDTRESLSKEISELTLAMAAGGKITQAKKYALKKQLAMAKAKRIRLEREAAKGGIEVIGNDPRTYFINFDDEKTQKSKNFPKLFKQNK